MAARTCRIGVHGRNDVEFKEIDYQVIREADLEVIKMMSHTKPEVFDRIKRENPNIEIITRLYDDRMNTGGHPTPPQFADRMIPIMRALKPYCTKFQIHNEPNHRDELEGWGPTDEDARSFNDWFLQAYGLLKDACPWASLGFPGLAMPRFIHRDRAWLQICRPAIERADWLGVHCYWQTPPNRPSVIFDPQFGLTFKYYHNQFPNKTLEILECGNSNGQADWHKDWAIPDEDVAGEYVKWLQELFKYDYINSASFFILSSQDAAWEFFAWRTENNHRKPVVQWVAQMHRPQLGKVTEPSPPSPPVVVPEPGEWTNQQIITAFHNASVKLGLGNWTLMGRAGIKLMDLVADRHGPYQGTAIDHLPNLTEEQKELIKAELAALVEPVEEALALAPEALGYLREQAGLVMVSLALPRGQQISLADTSTNAERRVARVWNRYGYLLLHVADRLALDPGVAVAVLAAQTDRRGIARNGRLVVRFENHVFFDQWEGHQDEFWRHFRFDPVRPWLKHQWRPSVDQGWRDCHGSQADEWATFEFAASLDETAAKLSTAMGLAQIMGVSYAALGYESVKQMFDAFSSAERYQLLAVFDLISGGSADSWQLRALRAHDFYAFATLHYGSKQGVRQGDTIRRLYEAFQKLNPL